MGPGKLQDHMLHDGLWDNVNDFHMGMSNELCSEKYNVSREDQDRYAAESYKRALTAIEEGRFKDEIIPVEIPQRKGEPIVFDTDETAVETPYDVLAIMKPAFKKNGVGTELLSYIHTVAVRQGLHGFTADVLSENHAMMHILNKSGFDIQKKLEAGSYELKMHFGHIDDFKL